MYFTLGDLPSVIRTTTSGQKEIGIIYSLFVNDVEITYQDLEASVNE